MNNDVTIFPIATNTALLNKYRLKRKIGQGSFGQVWLAHDIAVDHEYALKILPNKDTIDERLLEARVGHTFVHNNLVKVHQADVTAEGHVLIAMDYFPAGSVTGLANCANFIPLPTALRMISDVLQGLEHLHLHNFYHNDIKPQNILIGPQRQAKLTDYGIVGISSSGEAVAPSAWYVLHAAPEVTSGLGIEAKTDVFQVGMTLFRMLVGLGALEAKMNSLGQQGYALALSTGALITKADYPDFIPNSVRRIVAKAIHPNPAERFQSALEMRRAVEKIAFPGHWTVNDNGLAVGHDAKFSYSFEAVATGSACTLTCYRTSLSTGRRTKVTAFCRKSVPKVEMQKVLSSYVKAVVEGDL
jgi:serine/threonine protein kinase